MQMYLYLQVLDNLRTTAQNMVAIVNNALKCFTDMQSQLMPSIGTKVCIVVERAQCTFNDAKPSRLLIVQGKSSDKFNAAEYCQSVLFCNIEYLSIPLPSPHEFKEYPYKVLNRWYVMTIHIIIYNYVYIEYIIRYLQGYVIMNTSVLGSLRFSHFVASTFGENA